jgi:hypothetical protein
VSKVGPFSQTEIVGSVVQVSAPASVVMGGTRLYFRGWSDNRPATHTVTVPLRTKSLTVSYWAHRPGWRGIAGARTVLAPRPR